MANDLTNVSFVDACALAGTGALTGTGALARAGALAGTSRLDGDRAWIADIGAPLPRPS